MRERARPPSAFARNVRAPAKSTSGAAGSPRALAPGERGVTERGKPARCERVFRFAVECENAPRRRYALAQRRRESSGRRRRARAVPRGHNSRTGVARARREQRPRRTGEVRTRVSLRRRMRERAAPPLLRARAAPARSVRAPAHRATARESGSGACAPGEAGRARRVHRQGPSQRSIEMKTSRSFRERAVGRMHADDPNAI
jgi:hypothetical protein